MDGGTNSPENPDSYVSGDLPIYLLEPTKTHYESLGWFSASTGGDRLDPIVEGTTGDLTLYAQWEPTDYTINYDAGTAGSFETNANPETFNIEDSLPITLVAPVVTGETFDGWYKEPDFSGTEVTQITTVDLGSNITLYAKWL